MVLEVSHEDGVLELTLNRPDALNAFTGELHEALAAALKQARGPDVGAVLITGAGRGFCAGQDLSEIGDTAVGELIRRNYNPNLRALHALPKPVIAAVNGVAAGAGAALAFACDLRIASSKASFVPGFVAIGLVPDSGLSWTAPRLLGEARAFDWLTSNRRIGAEDALALGLVAAVAEPDELISHARERARGLAQAAGTAVGMTKRLLAAAATNTFDEQLELERQLQQAASEHPDYERAVQAFLKKA